MERYKEAIVASLIILTSCVSVRVVTGENNDANRDDEQTGIDADMRIKADSLGVVK